MDIRTMFDDIGKKIKSLAVILCCVGIIVYILTAICMISFGSREDEEAIITWGMIILIAGPLLSIINSFIIYGFGELIDKICIIERNITGFSFLFHMRNKRPWIFKCQFHFFHN